MRPQKRRGLKERGECQAQEGRFAEAMADLNRAAQLTPQDPWVYNKRGMVWFCQGEYQKAVADFTTAIRLAPDSPHLLFLPGQHLPAPPGRTGEGGGRLPGGLPAGAPPVLRELEKMGVKPEKSKQLRAGLVPERIRLASGSGWAQRLGAG